MSEDPQIQGSRPVEAIQGDIEAVKQLRTEVNSVEDHEELEANHNALKAELAAASPESTPATSPQNEALQEIGDIAAANVVRLSPSAGSEGLIDKHGVVLTPMEQEELRAGVPDVRK